MGCVRVQSGTGSKPISNHMQKSLVWNYPAGLLRFKYELQHHKSNRLEDLCYSSYEIIRLVGPFSDHTWRNCGKMGKITRRICNESGIYDMDVSDLLHIP